MTNSRARSSIGVTGILLTLLPLSACVPDDISPEALQQMRELLAEKDARTPAQRRLGSSLLYAMKALDGQPTLPDAANGVDTTGDGALVDLRVTSTPAVLTAIAQAGGMVLYAAPGSQTIRARVPLAQIEALAEAPTVLSIERASQARVGGQAFTSASQPIQGSLTTQGLISHAANAVQSSGIDGSGVRVGVLSDSAEATSFLISTGDLPADTTIVQDILGGPGSSEGSAMMEIVHDLAPGAQLFFASAFNGPDSFADNIRTLRNTYGCDVIVDDTEYTAADPPFQDGVIAQAVNDVTASGALYLSAIGNEGNATSGTSSVWEGDFVSAGTSALLPGYTLHSFGAQSFDRLLATTTAVDLFWSDPLGASSNDYDLFVLNAAGTAVLAASTNIQSGSQDPFEEIFSSAAVLPANARIVIAAKTGAAPRALHLENFFGERLQIATPGRTRGHAAASSAVSVAAVNWNSARTGTRPFVGGPANPTEIFSSDGPRRIFFDAAGTAITPGDLLFGTNGGALLVKPDLAAADGVTTRTPGFSPYFHTGAAAAHAAGIAALIKSAKPSLTPQQIRDAMTSTALDIRDAGIDRDSGYGIPMAPPAVDAALR